MTGESELFPKTKSLLIIGIVAIALAAIALTVSALLPDDPHPVATIRR